MKKVTIPPLIDSSILAKIIDHFKITSAIEESLQKVSKSFQIVSQNFPNNVLILSDYGWFISAEYTPISNIDSIAQLFKENNKTLGDDMMSKHFSSFAITIANDLAKAHPARKDIITKAFQAHENGDYELSIPVLLTQADGIAHETFDVTVYTRDNGKRRKLAEVIDKLDDISIDDSLMRLILGNLPLTLSTSSSEYDNATLNRHAILHGINTDFSTELNALKAISWIQFTSYLHEIIKENE